MMTGCVAGCCEYVRGFLALIIAICERGESGGLFFLLGGGLGDGWYIDSFREMYVVQFIF